MSSISLDCKHALRLYRRAPFSSLIVAGAFAVSIATCTAILSLYIDLVQPHRGFERADQIATIAESDGVADRGIPYAALERMTREMTSIVAAAAVSFAPTLIGPEREPISTGLVSEEFFGGLRPRLAFGTGFRPEDHLPDADPVVVLSYHYWQRRFGGRKDILGETIGIERNPVVRYQTVGLAGLFGAEPEVDSAQFRIVGVLAESAAEVGGLEPAVWAPLQRVWPLFVGEPGSLPDFLLPTYVRMGDGVSVEALLNELSDRLLGDDAIFQPDAVRRLVATEGMVANVAVAQDARRQLRLLLGAGFLLAFVAAANVSLYLLARAPNRRSELGIRMAVGAPGSRLARQLATEAGLMVVVAAAPGLLGSVWLSRYLANLPMLREANWRHVTLLEWRVLGSIGVFLAAVTLLVSLAPVLSLRRLSIARTSATASARATVAQRLAGTVQMVAAGTLGAAAIAFAWYLGTTLFGDSGFEIDDRYVIDRAGRTNGLPDDEAILAELDRRREIIESIPGVTAVAFGDPVPGEESGRRTPQTLLLDSGRRVGFSWGSINREFIDVLGLDLVRGRAPETGEHDAIVVNQTLAREVWGREDVVDEILPGSEGAKVVGVVEDIPYFHPASSTAPFAFRTLFSSFNLWAVVQTTLTPAQLTRELDELVAAGALDIPNTSVRSLRAMRYEALAPDRARGILTMGAAILVVVLSVLGFYGTQHFLVTAGRREYGIRAAVGAGPSTLGRLVHWRGLQLGVPGLVLGGILAVIVVETLRGRFVTETVSSALVVFWVVIGLVLLTLVASIGPARAARNTKPAVVLRED